MTNLLSRFELDIPSDEIQNRNVAVVMITGSLTTYARPGDSLDVTVTSIGDARSLAGGTLLQSPLKGPDGRIYALAQGPLTVGGYRYDTNGNQVQKNHPTVGLITNGATVEVGVADADRSSPRNITFVLHDPDFTTGGRIADAINGSLGDGSAEVRDAAGVDIRIPEQLRDRIPVFMRQIEALSVEPDRRARVVVNERTGTVVSGGDVRLSKVAVSHGDLKVTVEADTTVSQPFVIGRSGPGVETRVITNHRLKVEEPNGTTFIPPGHTTVADLVQALSRAKTSTRDVIGILQAIKAAGALHADLIVQ